MICTNKLILLALALVLAIAPVARAVVSPANLTVDTNSQPSLVRHFVKLDKVSKSSVKPQANTKLLTTSTIAHQHHQHQHQHQQNQQALQVHKNIAPEQQLSSNKTDLLHNICIGTSNYLNGNGNNSKSELHLQDHHKNLAERYRDCTYVSGNLELTWLDSEGQHLDMSFLESIREITGYLLIAHVHAERIRMPNLQIIRGRELYRVHEKEEEFALILMDNQLSSLELPNLREILYGSVGFHNNRNLGHIRTINWEEILNPLFKSIFVYDGPPPDKPECHPTCGGYCWADGPDMCQKLSTVHGTGQCHAQCYGRCYGLAATECCHSFCAGGCSGPKQSDCFACKNYYDDGECKQECPSMQRYNPTKFLWEPDPNGKYAYGSTCVKKCPEHLLRDNGACVRSCPPDKRQINGECTSCTGPCPKNCLGVDLVHSGNINQLINCTVIDGSLTILDASFTGNSNVPISATTTPSSNSTSSATTAFKPMHPDRLEVFRTLREITGYLYIQANHSDFRNLSYFSNLKTIGGRQTTDMLYALSITKTSLTSLNLRSLARVKGRINIEENKELCFADTIDWNQLNITAISTRDNAPNYKCRQLGLQCHEQCARDGCWGPGPDECLSCKNYKLDDYCVDNCSSSLDSLGFPAYELQNATNSCKRCHHECQGGCSGPNEDQCWQCRHVKDGPYCVSECPSQKFQRQGVCVACHESCMGGCTGTSNALGSGGCKSCGKAIINSTLDSPLVVAHCIRADEPCPEGYYQEYVGHHAEGPLKLSSGRPVCRKCHHRCKSCTGMGSHVSVCECAKYVANEQCEDYCPRDYFADEQLRQCVKCSPECNGCFGPTEADCITCRVYRNYLDSNNMITASNQPLDSTSATAAAAIQTNGNQGGRPFNCTAQCPQDKPHRISESNMLDPYCSAMDPGQFDHLDNPRITFMDSNSFIFLFIISVALSVCVYVYRSQIEQDKTVKLTMHLSGIDDVEPLTPSNMKPNLAPMRSIKETELRKGKLLGSGFGGTVYQGFWYPEGQEHKAPKVVAIKELRDNGSSNLNKEFLDEAYIMASVNHPNLVRLLAVCMTRDHLMLVTPLMPLGCLLDYVKKNKSIIGAKNLLEWCKQIAKGMAYLEEQRMVHRDLALRNVLLQTTGRAMISDFGLAKFLELDQSEYHSGGGRLPIKWLAPECIRERKFTHKSDVWAFGVTAWELMTFGQRPFEEYETKDVPAAIDKGARLHQPSYMSTEVYKVLYACWFYSPDDRPKFRSLHQSFVSFARDPERYLICNTKGIDYSKVNQFQEQGQVSAPGDSDTDHDDYDGTSSEVDCDDQPSPSSLADSPLNRVVPLNTMPELTPTTHNRLNEIFGFQMSCNTSSSKGVDQQQQQSSPMKKVFSPAPDDVFHSAEHHHHHHHHLRQHHNHHHHQHHHKQQVDANNNNSLMPTANCWHHSVSSLGKPRSSSSVVEHPTDMYDYLLPSPLTADAHSAEHSHFGTFYGGPYSAGGHKTGGSPLVRHSASGVNNEEYFMSRQSNSNYVNDGHSQLERQMSTSSGNIPHSLV